MPAALPLIGAALLAAGPLTLIGKALAYALILSPVAFGERARRKANRAARAAWEASLRDRAITVRGAELPRSLTYGRVRIGGQLVYARSFGAHSDRLLMVIALRSGHEIDAIETVSMGERSLGTLGGDGHPTDGPFITTRSDVDASASSTADGTATRVVTLPHVPVAGSVTAQYATGSSGGDWGPMHEPLTIASVVGASVTVNTTRGTDGGNLPAGTAIFVHYRHAQVDNTWVRCKRYLGTAAQIADADAIADSGGEWTVDHRGRGVPCLYLWLRYHPDLFPAGVENISAVVRGARCHDPRTGTTIYTRNPALIARDYLTSPLGFGCSAAEIDDALVIAAANVCDELVTVQTSPLIQQPRYTCDVDLSTETARDENLQIILDSMAGHVVYSQGRWRLYAGAYTAPSVTLDESTLADSQSVTMQARVERSQLFNAVKGIYLSELNSWQPADYPLVGNSMYETQDGGERMVTELNLPATNDAWMAQRLAKIALERSRQALTVRAAFNLRAYAVTPGDTIALSLARYGFSGKPMRVIDREFDTARGVVLTLREESAGVYDWAHGEATRVDLAPNTNLPSPWTPPVMTALTLASGAAHLLRLLDGSVVVRIHVSWPALVDAGVTQGGHIEVEHRLLSAAAWTPLPPLPGTSTQVFVSPVAEREQYLVRARAVNGVGAHSQWVYGTPHTVIGKTAPPSNVTGATATIEQFGVRIQITPVPDRDVDEYVVRQGGTDWGSATPLDASAETVIGPGGYLWRVQIAGARTLRIRARDWLRNLSAAEFLLAVTVPAPSATGLTAAINARNVRLAWTGVPGLTAIREYVVERDAGGGTWIEWDRGDVTYSERRADWLGARTFRVHAIDAAGNVGTSSTTTISITAPAAPVVSVSVLNNRVIVTATDSQTTLPIERIELRRGAVGATWATATSLGVLGPSRLANFEETVGGHFDYLMRATDSAGNESAEGRTSAVVSEPPGFRRFLNYDGNFTLGTRTQVLIEAVTNRLLAPFNATETEADHYSTRAWTTDQAKIDAGYTFIAHPTATTGAYVEDMDFGSTVAAALITATLTSLPLVGAVTVQPRISHRLALTDPWIDGPLGQAQLFATNFRYFRVRYEFSSLADGARGQFGVLACSSFNTRLSVERKTDAGSVTVAAGDTGGTLVTFGRTDFDIPPVVMPSSGEPGAGFFAEVDHGATTRTTCRLFLFDAAGVRRSGRVNWIAEQGV